MGLPKFEIFRPHGIDEACQLLLKYADEGAAILAGGTDLLVNIRRTIIPAHLPRCQGCDPKTGRPIVLTENPPKYIISITSIPELKGIRETDSGEIQIGSLTTISEICKSGLIRKRLCALAEGGDNLGSPLVRNRGTIGGNICNARPAADMLIPAYALAGKLELASKGGKRVVPVEEFVIGPGKTIIGKGEILTNIIFTQPLKNSGSAAVKLANRKALEIGVVNAAAFLRLDESGKTIEFAKIALGAVGPTPILAQKAVDFLRGKAPEKDNFRRAGEIASGECKPITDHRGSALYRIDMVKILVSRILEKTLARIRD